MIFLNDLISVVVPIYNVEDYLEKCIDSLLNQTYTNLEIILVDDGSPDSCPLICEKYAKIDDRIIVIHKSNGGLSDARNFGIDKATGKYVSFIDSDDYIDKRYIEVLYQLIMDTNSDISIVSANVVYPNDIMVPNLMNLSDTAIRVYDKDTAIRETLKVNLSQNAWGKLYRLDLFDEIRFPVGLLYEDLAIVYRLLEKSTQITYADIKLYNYLVRDNSIMRSAFSIKQYAEVGIIDNEMDWLLDHHKELREEIDARKVYSYFVVLERILFSKDKGDYLAQRKELSNKIKSLSKGMIFKETTKKSLKIKLLAYKFGERPFYYLMRLSKCKR